MDYKFMIEKKIVDNAFNFAEEIWETRSQSRADFGSGHKRDKNDFIADTAEGKIAEEGFSLFLYNNFNIKMIVDYGIYPDIHEIDYGNDLQLFEIGNDSRIGNMKVDVKSSKPYAKWLLIEKYKCWADSFVMASVNGLRTGWEKDPHNSLHPRLSVTVSGFCYHHDLVDVKTKKPWFLFRQGESLIDPILAKDLLKISDNAIILSQLLELTDIKKMNVFLKSSENYGIPKNALRNSSAEWEHLVNSVTASSLSFKL